MPFPLTKDFQETEAFFPLSDKWIPHKPQRLEPLTAVGRHGVFILALPADPPS